MKKFGIRMNGCEEELEKLLKQHYLAFKEKVRWDYNLVEIGTAGATTLKAFYDILLENSWDGDRFRAIGFDLPNGYTFNWKEVHNNLNNGFFYAQDGLIKDIPIIPTRVPSIILCDGRKYMKNHWQFPIHFCLIDGSHCFTCVQLDFQAIERFVAPKGLVIFHDAGLEEQGTDHQDCEHGGFIEVRKAIENLGLFDNKRPGWKFLGMIDGNRKSGGEGNSIAIFEKEK